MDPLEKRKNISHIREENLGHAEKGDYLSFKGTISYISHEKDPWYNACPTCQKKVVDLGNSMWRCEKCNNEYPNVSVITLSIIDESFLFLVGPNLILWLFTYSSNSFIHYFACV